DPGTRRRLSCTLSRVRAASEAPGSLPAPLGLLGEVLEEGVKVRTQIVRPDLSLAERSGTLLRERQPERKPLDQPKRLFVVAVEGDEGMDRVQDDIHFVWLRE